MTTSALLPEEGSASAPARRPGRNRANTRERLLEAGRTVFVAKGLKRVTVDDLTSAAGFTRGAFYSNFSSVDEVFHAVFRARAERLLRTAREAVEQTEVVDVDFVVALLDALSSDREWAVLQSEFTLLALRDEEARALLGEFSAQFRAELAEVITLVLDRLGRRPTLPVDQVAQVVVGLQHQLATARALGQFGAGPGGEEAADALVRQVMTLLVTELSEPARG